MVSYHSGDGPALWYALEEVELNTNLFTYKLLIMHPTFKRSASKYSYLKYTFEALRWHPFSCSRSPSSGPSRIKTCASSGVTRTKPSRTDPTRAWKRGLAALWWSVVTPYYVFIATRDSTATTLVAHLVEHIRPHTHSPHSSTSVHLNLSLSNKQSQKKAFFMPFS